MNFVNERERGKIPLSIGTSLAFESILNIHDEVKHPKPLYEDNQVIWINVKTLFRNLYGAIDRDRIDLTTDRQLAEALIEEIELIKDICRNEAKGIDVVFYYPNYKNLDKINHEVLLKLDNTALQKTYTKRLNAVSSIVLTHYNSGILTNKRKDHPDIIRVYDNKILDYDNRKALMISNYAYDLVAFRKFNRLLLVESHTGTVKDRTTWYTKYLNGKNLPEMPFREDLLTIMGDTTLFRNKVPAMKREIIRMAEDHHWSSITSASKIRENIKLIKNHELRYRLEDCISGI